MLFILLIFKRPAFLAPGGEFAHRHTNRHVHTQTCSEKERTLPQLSLIADFYKGIREVCVCVYVVSKCWSGLQVLWAAAWERLYQNPSGGRNCEERRRREETVGNCGDNTRGTRKQSRSMELMRKDEGQQTRRDDRQEGIEGEEKRSTPPSLTRHESQQTDLNQWKETLHTQTYLLYSRRRKTNILFILPKDTLLLILFVNNDKMQESWMSSPWFSFYC